MLGEQDNVNGDNHFYESQNTDRIVSQNEEESYNLQVKYNKRDNTQARSTG